LLNRLLLCQSLLLQHALLLLLLLSHLLFLLYAQLLLLLCAHLLLLHARLLGFRCGGCCFCLCALAGFHFCATFSLFALLQSTSFSLCLGCFSRTKGLRFQFELLPLQICLTL
jgi:hypothetical protein